MAKEKVMRIVGERITKVSGSATPMQSGEIQKKVVLVLENGDRITIRDDHEFFKNASRMKPGDVISCDFTGEFPFKPEDGDRTYTYLTGASNFEFELGSWNDTPDARLADRSEATFVAKAAFQATAAPVAGAAAYQAPAPAAAGAAAASSEKF